MDSTSAASVQQSVGAALQKSMFATQASMVSKILGSASGGLQQPSQADGGLRADALAGQGIGTRLDVVA